MKIVLGVLLLFLLFVSIFITGVKTVGWRQTFESVGITAIIVITTVIAAVLINEGM
jgi:hypothetical protein